MLSGAACSSVRDTRTFYINIVMYTFTHAGANFTVQNKVLSDTIIMLSGAACSSARDARTFYIIIATYTSTHAGALGVRI